MSRLLYWLIGLLSISPAVKAADPPVESDYYEITTFEIPLEETLEASGFQWMADGRLAVCSRRGDIFMINDPLGEQVTDDQFSVFARGLHEPLSLAEKGGWLYATQRPEVTRMRDVDGDGTADIFETVADDWGVSGDYHEYAFGSKFDEDGNLIVALCLTGSFSSEVPFRGWAMKITPEGDAVPFSSGVRSPGGVGANLAGDIFYTENQGPWNGACSLKLLRQGAFVGHPGGFQWYKLCAGSMGPEPIEPESGSRMAVQADRIEQLIPPAVMFPYAKMGKSASGIACDVSKGKFGPFAGQLFVGDQSASTLMRVDLEVVDGVYQGACFPFLKGFASGNVGVEMAPDGAMFVGGTNRGWGSVGPRPFAIQRVDWTGKVPFEIQHMKLEPNGFRLTFTQPIDEQSAANPDSYRLSTYTYEYRAQYGSPEVDATTPVIQSVEVSDDGLSATVVIDGLQRGHVHELHAEGVRNRSGLPLLHTQAYYTVNQLR